MSALEQLRDRWRTIHNVNHAYQYLSWDEAVMMPHGGGRGRADSLATLKRLVHEMVIDPSLEALVEQARSEAEGSEWDQANLRIIERERKRASAIPSDLVMALSKASSACEQEWRNLRQQNDWKSVLPLLTEVINLTLQRGEILGECLDMDVYDAMLDEYEPGLTQEFVNPIFDSLVGFLPDFVDNVIASQDPPRKFSGDYSPESQLDLARKLMKTLGFNFERGRIDTSHHPFSCGEFMDTRITTRFSSDDFVESMYAVLHETGHALYQQGLPPEWHGQPVGNSLGMMLHESQSLFMEMQVCRGDAFLRHSMPVIEESLSLKGNGAAWNLDSLSAAVRRVGRGKIRVDADETTYPLHVVLRYRIERAITSGDMGVDDIPAAWDENMRDLFGFELGDDFKDGCMQDVHWFAGLFGYFPCYSLGALTAAQFYKALIRDIPDIEDDFAAGSFDRVLNWLRSNIHGQGQLVSSFDLIEKVTGSPLDGSAFIDHVQSRYGSSN